MTERIRKRAWQREPAGALDWVEEVLLNLLASSEPTRSLPPGDTSTAANSRRPAAPQHLTLPAEPAFWPARKRDCATPAAHAKPATPPMANIHMGATPWGYPRVGCSVSSSDFDLNVNLDSSSSAVSAHPLVSMRACSQLSIWPACKQSERLAGPLPESGLTFPSI